MGFAGEVEEEIGRGDGLEIRTLDDHVFHDGISLRTLVLQGHPEADGCSSWEADSRRS